MSKEMPSIYLNTVHPLSKSYTQSQDRIEGNLMFTMPQIPLSPPCYHCQGSNYALTHVDQMTVCQTERWIMTLGRFYGWVQTDKYATLFRKHNIHGKLLESLTDEMLNSAMGIRDQTHRQVLLLTIQKLHLMDNVDGFMEPISGILNAESSHYSSCNRGRSSVQSDYKSNNLHLVSALSICTDEPTQMEYSDEVGFSQRSIAVSKNTTSVHSFGDDEFSTPSMSSVQRGVDKKDDVIMLNKKEMEASGLKVYHNINRFRCRKLQLILRTDQIVQDECPISAIRYRFQELKIPVEVQAMENKPTRYTLIFPNFELADKALSQSKEIGWKLRKKRPPKPCPKHPQKYIALAILEIRAGKAMSGDFIGELERGTIITVNQIKKRRLRLCEIMENGTIVNLGWVSQYDEDGSTLLAQLGDF